jgi:glycerophosphoryl diester phosphodiesterase
MPVFDVRPAVLGHRGLGKGDVLGHTENTLGSFLTAVELGLTWLEVDVRRTADHVLVVMHQPAYDDGTFLADISGDQASSRGTLSLSELLDALPAHVGVDFDLKSSMEDAARERLATTAALVAPVARQAGRDRPVCVTSFDPAALAVVREVEPSVPLGLLTWLDFPVGHAVAAAAHLDVQLLAVHCGSLRPNRIEPASQQRPLEYVVSLVHGSGRQMLAWCPDIAQARELIAADADALCVNDVPAALAALMPGTAR